MEEVKIKYHDVYLVQRGHASTRRDRTGVRTSGLELRRRKVLKVELVDVLVVHVTYRHLHSTVVL